MSTSTTPETVSTSVLIIGAGGAGLRGSLDPEDRWTIHAADTLDEGHFVNDPTAEGMEIDFHVPDAPSAEVQRAVDEEHELDYHHLE